VKTILKLFIGSCIFSLLMLQPGCTGPVVPTPATTNFASISVAEDNVTLQQGTVESTISGTHDLGPNSTVTTDISGAATMSFDFTSMQAEGKINSVVNNKMDTRIIARPDPNFANYLFYLQWGIAHFGWVGKGSKMLTCGADEEDKPVADIYSDDPLVRFIVDRKNHREYIRIAVFSGSVTATIHGNEYKISTNQELVYSSDSREVIPIRTPVFEPSEKQIFAEIANKLGIDLPAPTVPTLTPTSPIPRTVK